MPGRAVTKPDERACTQLFGDDAPVGAPARSLEGLRGRSSARHRDRLPRRTCRPLPWTSFCWPSLPRSWHSLWATCAGSCRGRSPRHSAPLGCEPRLASRGRGRGSSRRDRHFGDDARALWPLCALDRRADCGTYPSASALAGAPAGRVRRRDGFRSSSPRIVNSASLNSFCSCRLFFFLYVANEVRTQGDVVFIVVGLLAGFLLESTVMIAQSALGISFGWMGLSSNTRELVGASASDVRAGGTIGGANAAAAYIAMLLPISLVVLWMDVTAWIKRLALVATPVGVVALVFTYSRGGWLAAIVAALFVTIVAVHRGDIPGAGLQQRARWFSFFSSHSTAASKPEFPARPKGRLTPKRPASADRARVEDHSGSTHSGCGGEQLRTGNQPIRGARVQWRVAAHRP